MDIFYRSFVYELGERTKGNILKYVQEDVIRTVYLMDFSDFFLVATQIQIDNDIKSSVVFYAKNCISLVPFQIWGELNIIKHKFRRRLGLIYAFDVDCSCTPSS